MKSRNCVFLLMILFLGAFSLVNCGGGGGGGSSSTPPDTTAPSTPSGITANADSTTEITVSWSASTDNAGVAGYKVYRDGSLFVTIQSPSTLSYPNTGLRPMTNYSYNVSAYDAAGNESPQSSAVNAATFTPQTTQLSSSGNDSVQGMAVDGSGNVYMAGYTEGNLDGTNAGGKDIFLVKYSASGVKQWTVQIGSPADEEAKAVAVDGSGNVYIAGYTNGSLDGANAGGKDIFLAEYDTNKNPVWKKQLGTANDDVALGIAVDEVSGDFYVVGYTEGGLEGGTHVGGQDAFLLKYLAKNLEWRVQVGSPADEEANGVVVDGSGNIYWAGYTEGSLSGQIQIGGRDVFLKKYSYDSMTATLAKVWDKQFGTPQDDAAYGVAMDGSGNAYVTGYTAGSLDGTNAGGNDIFLARYDPSGTQLWKTQLGTFQDDSARAVVVDGSANAFIAGTTAGALDGQPNKGALDFFLAKFNTSGARQWVFQDGTAANDTGNALALDNTGNFVYLAGDTADNLYGMGNSGGLDIFLIKSDLNGVIQ
jgi:chitodextrinase